MKWVRSWPDPMPHRKSHVIDGMERFYHNDYDYSRLVEYGEDILLIEWDLAASQEMREDFEHVAKIDPHHVTVAPYRLYEGREESVWAHRRIEDGQERWLKWGETYTDLFGFGLIYLPHKLMRAFLNEPKETRGTPVGIRPENYTDYRFCDQTFSMWHYRSGLGPVYVHWPVMPIHLNEGKWQP